MSLALFNAVPAGAIETLFDDQNQPWFKRADLGRYLGIIDVARNFKYIKTTSRLKITGQCRPPPRSGMLGGGKNSLTTGCVNEAVLSRTQIV